jgi:Fe2+ transport system protein FeoA
MEMGIVPGSVINVVRYAPLGDPLEIKLKGCLLSLRKEEAELVEITKEN